MRLRYTICALTLALLGCGSDVEPDAADATAHSDVAEDGAADATTPEDAEDGTADATTPEDAEDGAADATTPEDAEDVADPADSAAPDTGKPLDAVGDAASSDAADGAAVEPTTTEATPGVPCDRRERIAIIEVAGPGSGPQGHVHGWVLDRPYAWFGPPELTTEICDFHRMSTTPCADCSVDEICGFDAACAPAPQRLRDVAVVLEDGDGTQTVEVDPMWGDLSEQLELPGQAMTLELTFADQRVTLAATDLPPVLADAAGVLEGEYDHPTALDLAWAVPDDRATVFTHIPINHHVGGPTFTECVVDAAAGAMHIDEAMLVPLAVVTGLEFQSISHVRFAAAETPAGCVEIRYSGGRQFISLF